MPITCMTCCSQRPRKLLDVDQICADPGLSLLEMRVGSGNETTAALRAHGLHFASIASRMLELEIGRSTRTGDEAVRDGCYEQLSEDCW